MADTELANVAIPQSATLSHSIGNLEGTRQPSLDEEGEPSNGGRAEQQLAPVYGGSAAWRLLCAAFLFEALLWGKLASMIGLAR